MVSLKVEQPFFPMEPSAIASQTAVGTDNAMAWNDDADAIHAVRGGNRAHGLLFAQRRRLLAVGAGFTVGNSLEDIPYSTLEPGARSIDCRVPEKYS